MKSNPHSEAPGGSPRPAAEAPVRHRAGFTAIELLGVLAILTVLGLVVGEQVIQKLKRSEQRQEGVNLETQADAYKLYIARNMRIPSATDWASVVANELAQPLQKVQQNRPGYARVFVSDPNLSIPTVTGAVTLATQPYLQDVNGATNQPTNSRLMIVSCLTRPVPSLAGSGFGSSWVTPEDKVPSDWLAADATWANKGEEIKVQRMDLQGLFHRLILNNLDVSLPALYSLGNSVAPISGTNPGTNSIAVGSLPLEAWFLEGTLLQLRFANTALQVAEFLHADGSYIFEDGAWHRSAADGSGIGATQLGVFGQLVTNYLAAPYPPWDQNQFGSSQQAVIDEFYTYLWTYGQWALENFPTGGSSTAQQVPSFRVVSDSQNRLDDFSANLLK